MEVILRCVFYLDMRRQLGSLKHTTLSFHVLLWAFEFDGQLNSTFTLLSHSTFRFETFVPALHFCDRELTAYTAQILTGSCHKQWVKG
jgi:hypothetical protein